MKCTRLFFLFLLIPFLLCQAQDPAQRWWDHELTFDSLPPEQIPPWAFRGKGGLPSLEDEKLVLTTVDESQSIAYVLEDPATHDSVTVEFRVKARENLSRFAGQFNVSLNGKVYVIPITNAEALTYRLVLENEIMTLYKEGEDPSEIKGAPDARGRVEAGQLLFGDASSAAVGTTEWSALRWAWGKAVPQN